LFGGDLGRYGRPVLPDPSPGGEADIVLVESTYGDRVHPPDDDGAALAEIIRSTAERRGRVIVPAFAIGRVEEVLYWVKRLEDEKRIPVLPVWVDSPMATEALVQYARRVEELDPDMKPAQPLPQQNRAVAAFATDRLQIVASPQQSRELVGSRGPAIVISSSGMATGGRVLNHLAVGLQRPENTVLFVGFQAAGTRGRQLIEGARTVRIHGTDVPVNARVAHLDSMSAHADSAEIMRWLRTFTRPPSQTYIVHGEPTAAAALQQKIAAELRWNASIAQYLQQVQV
jgi:metallo-beta-lactamase family protein